MLFIFSVAAAARYLIFALQQVYGKLQLSLEKLMLLAMNQTSKRNRHL